MKVILVFLLIAVFYIPGFTQEEPKHNKAHSCCSSSQESSIKNKIWNKECPVMGGKVDIEVSTAAYNNKEYGFCCAGCIAKFQKDPKRYESNLDSNGEYIKH